MINNNLFVGFFCNKSDSGVILAPCAIIYELTALTNVIFTSKKSLKNINIAQSRGRVKIFKTGVAVSN